MLVLAKEIDLKEKKVVEVPTRLVINSSDKVIEKIEKMLME